MQCNSFFQDRCSSESLRRDSSILEQACRTTCIRSPQRIPLASKLQTSLSCSYSPFAEPGNPEWSQGFRNHGDSVSEKERQASIPDFQLQNLLKRRPGFESYATETSSTHTVVAEVEEKGWLEDNEIAGKLPELRDMLELLKRLRREEEDGSMSMSAAEGAICGNVYLVGTGPGDPELLTLKALRIVSSADLVLYDRLVSLEILRFTRPDARLLYVGKTSGYHSRTQEEIHELLLSFAEAGARVVRLKGGDPLVFGRGGEEMDYLQSNGVHVEIVPGITAASGISASLGIPLTHRGIANSVRFLTGHSRKGGMDPLYVVANAGLDPDSTLVVYMGLQTLPGLTQKLLETGLKDTTAAVAVERGTTPQQRTVFGTLSTLPSLVESASLVSPTLVIIGEVVRLSPYWPERLHHPASAESVGSVTFGSNQFAEGQGPQFPFVSEEVHLATASREVDLGGHSATEGTQSRTGRDARDRRMRLADPPLPSEKS